MQICGGRKHPTIRPAPPRPAPPRATYSQQRREGEQAQDAYLLRVEGGRALYSMFATNRLKCRRRRRRAEDGPAPARVALRHRAMT